MSPDAAVLDVAGCLGRVRRRRRRPRGLVRRSPRARRSRSSAPTARASRRCSGRSWACSPSTHGLGPIRRRRHHADAHSQDLPPRAWRTSPAERHLFPQMTRAREPDARCVPRQTRCRARGLHLRRVPTARRASEAGCRHHERRRAADARRRSGADVATEGADARRTDHRSRSDCSPERRTMRSAGCATPGSRWWSPSSRCRSRSSSPRRGYVLENGRIELSGTSEELAGNPDVQRAYLGVA